MITKNHIVKLHEKKNLNQNYIIPLDFATLPLHKTMHNTKIKRKHLK